MAVFEITDAKGKRSEFGVGKLPRRKQPCLYAIEGARIIPLAYFISDKAAARFVALVTSAVAP